MGVVHALEREAWGDDVPAVVGQRYDALLWFERTRPLRPLHGEPGAPDEQQTWPYAVWTARAVFVATERVAARPPT